MHNQMYSLFLRIQTALQCHNSCKSHKIMVTIEFSQTDQLRNDFMAIQGLDHVNINTSNMKETMRFYKDLLNFTDEFLLPFDLPITWLYTRENALIQLMISDSESYGICNPVDQFPFYATSFEETKQRLENANWKFRCSDVS